MNVILVDIDYLNDTFEAIVVENNQRRIINANFEWWNYLPNGLSYRGLTNVLPIRNRTDDNGKNQ